MVVETPEFFMPKLTVIVGMAGSGKTWLCNAIADQSEPRAFTFSDATLAFNDYRRAGHQCLGEMVARLLGRDEHCVMDESHLTDPHFRTQFKEFCDTFLVGVEQEWIFFEADIVACVNNLYRDKTEGGRHELCRYQALENQRKRYHVPSEADCPGRKTYPVHCSANPKFDQSSESAAIEWLQSQIKSLRHKNDRLLADRQMC